MPRHVVQAGKHLIHKIKIDLPQAQGVDAAQGDFAAIDKAWGVGFRGRSGQVNRRLNGRLRFKCSVVEENSIH